MSHLKAYLWRLVSLLLALGTLLVFLFQQLPERGSYAKIESSESMHSTILRSGDNRANQGQT